MKTPVVVAACTIGAMLCLGALSLVVATRNFEIPLFRLPEPLGSIAVGTSTLRISEGPKHVDAIDVQIWYPAIDDRSKKVAPYLLSARGSLRTRLLASLVKTHSRVGVRPRDGRWPIVVSLPGWGGMRENNTALAESLASVGYVVVAIDDLVKPQRQMNFDSRSKMQESIAWANRKLAEQVHFVVRILDGLSRIDSGSGGDFFAKLDTKRVGVLGFSFGGATAAETASLDRRILAAINMDGSMYGSALAAGVSTPFMIMFSSPSSSQERPPAGALSLGDAYDQDNGALMMRGIARRGGFTFTIAGSDHLNFIDAALLPSIRHTGTGSVDPNVAYRAIASTTIAFFNRYVRDDCNDFEAEARRFSDTATLRHFTSTEPKTLRTSCRGVER